MFAGSVSVGGVVSRTVTVNVFVPTLPRASVALHVTVVVPIANVAPLGGVHVTASAPSTVSVADVAKLNAAPVGPVASTVALAGTVTTGAVVSLTVTVNDPVPTLARASLAVHVTVVAPIARVAPLAGVQLTETAPSTRSLAVALKVESAPVALVASAVMFAGSVSDGAVVSRTVTVKVFVALFA